MTRKKAKEDNFPQSCEGFAINLRQCRKLRLNCILHVRLTPLLPWMDRLIHLWRKFMLCSNMGGELRFRALCWPEMIYRFDYQNEAANIQCVTFRSASSCRIWSLGYQYWITGDWKETSCSQVWLKVAISFKCKVLT